MDLDVIWRNLHFLMIQGFLGFGNFAGGTLRLAIPAIVLGFVLGIFIGIGRLAPQWWVRLPATLYVEFFRGVPLVMVIFWMWFVMPMVLGTAIPEFGVALGRLRHLRGGVLRRDRPRGHPVRGARAGGGRRGRWGSRGRNRCASWSCPRP